VGSFKKARGLSPGFLYLAAVFGFVHLLPPELLSLKK
jgi:hypothetical protein